MSNCLQELSGKDGPIINLENLRFKKIYQYKVKLQKCIYIYSGWFGQNRRLENMCSKSRTSRKRATRIRYESSFISI